MKIWIYLIAFLLTSLTYGQNGQVPTTQGKPLFVPGEVLVRLKENTAGADKARLLGAKAHAAPSELKGVYRLELEAGEDVQARVEELKKDPAVDLVQPNYCYYASSAPASCSPNVLNFATPEYWPLTIIQAPQAWATINGSCSPLLLGAGVTVAVLDTGVSVTHPGLTGVSVSGSVTNSVSGGINTADDYGHGTYVAGILAGQWNANGMAGLAPGITLMPIKVLDHCGKGNSDEIAAGTIFAVNHGARVLNFSLGGPGQDDLEQEAIDQALSAGCVVVAASGNESNLPGTLAPLNYPAAYPGVLSVGASDENDHVAPYSNGGTGLEMVAPGGTYSGLPAPSPSNFSLFASQLIFSTILDPSAPLCAPVTQSDFILDPANPLYGVAAGTSAATPFVSATAALLFSVHPDMTNNQVVNAIVNNTESLNGNTGWDAETGYGRLNVYQALLNAQNSTGKITPFLKTFNYPNPFYPDMTPSITITVPLASSQMVELTIRDSGGKLVFHEITPALPQFKSFGITWDGRNSTGQLVTTGIYFYTVTAGGVTGHNKIVVVRGSTSP